MSDSNTTDPEQISLTGSLTFKNQTDDLENGSAPSEKKDPAEKEIGFRKRKTGSHWLLVALLLLVVVVVILVIVYAIEVKKNRRTSSKDNAKVCYTPECLTVAGTVLASMNNSFDPCQNFAKYTCEGWVKNNPIPPGSSERGRADLIMRSNLKKLRDFIEDLTDDLPRDDPRRLIRAYYRSCMDEAVIDENSLADLAALLPQLGAWPLLNLNWDPGRWNWLDGLVQLQRFFLQTTPLMIMDVKVDPKYTKEFTLQIQPLTSDMADINNSTKMKDAQMKYFTKILTLLGAKGPNVQRELEKVFQFKKNLKKIIPPYITIYENYYRTSYIWELETTTGFPWLSYINKLISVSGISVTRDKRLIVPDVAYFKGLIRLLNETDKRTTANFFMLYTIEALIPMLSSSFRKARSQLMVDMGEDVVSRPRWEVCVDQMNEQYGLQMILGYLWVNRAFDKGIVPMLKEMWDHIKQAFRERVTELTWLDKETKLKVREKVDVMKDKMGYPEVCDNITLLKDYVKGMEFTSEIHFLLGATNVTKWASAVSLSKLGKRVQGGEWFSGPQFVNAFYRMTQNEINILAGMLQPPFYYGKDAPRAINFGGIGTVLGHELVHGFDTWGRMFNKEGVIGPQWWSSFTIRGFKHRSQCMIDQYGNFSIDVGNNQFMNLNGFFSLSENIADNAGLALSYRAYRNWARENGEELVAPGLGLTNDQLLFVGFGQIYCYHAKPSAIKSRLALDSHSLPPYRATGSVSNSENFPKVFHCPRGAKMNPSKKCKIW